jgi:hypothetical protein
MFKFTFAALAAAACVLVVSPASATVVLDQASIPETGHTPFSGSVGFSVGPNGLGQTFTVGVSGKLDHVAVDVENWSAGPASDLRFDLLDSSFGSILTRSIAGSAIPVLDFSGFDVANVINFDLRAAGINVLSGEQFILKVSSQPGNGAAPVWRASFGGSLISYPDPSYSFDFPAGFPGPAQLGNKFGFRTYVETGAVPEPGAWAMMIMGLGMVGAVARQGRRARALAA